MALSGVLQSCKQLVEDVVVLAFYEVDNLNEDGWIPEGPDLKQFKNPNSSQELRTIPIKVVWRSLAGQDALGIWIYKVEFLTT